MNQLRFTANPETNFVYHMMSVAQVGYDNDYGARFRPDYPPEDLTVLQRHEKLLTVRGRRALRCTLRPAGGCARLRRTASGRVLRRPAGAG